MKLILKGQNGFNLTNIYRSFGKGKFKKGEKEEYAKQLYLYALAVKRKYGEYPKYLFFNMFY